MRAVVVAEEAASVAGAALTVAASVEAACMLAVLEGFMGGRSLCGPCASLTSDSRATHSRSSGPSDSRSPRSPNRRLSRLWWRVLPPRLRCCGSGGSRCVGAYGAYGYNGNNGCYYDNCGQLIVRNNIRISIDALTFRAAVCCRRPRLASKSGYPVVDSSDPVAVMK